MNLRNPNQKTVAVMPWQDESPSSIPVTKVEVEAFRQEHQCTHAFAKLMVRRAKALEIVESATSVEDLRPALNFLIKNIGKD